MELSCHFFWLLRPQIEWTIKCHKKKSLGSIKRALEWAIKVESEKPGDSKTYINDTQQQPHLLKRSDGGRKKEKWERKTKKSRKSWWRFGKAGRSGLAKGQGRRLTPSVTLNTSFIGIMIVFFYNDSSCEVHKTHLTPDNCVFVCSWLDTLEYCIWCPWI